MKNYISIDVETTGLNPYSDRIVEVGALAFDSTGREISRFQSLVNPGRHIPEQVTAIHGIVDEDVVHAPDFAAVSRSFFNYLDSVPDRVILAHNALFDVGFINGELDRAITPVTIPAYSVLCTMLMAKRRYPSFRSHSLPNLIRSIGLPDSTYHRSMADCIHCRNLFLKMAFSEAELESPTMSRFAISADLMFRGG